MSVVRLHDWVLPRTLRNITVGVGLGGWGPDGDPAKLVAIEDGDMAICEFAVAPWGMDRGRKPTRIYTTLAGLHRVEVILVPHQPGRVRTNEEKAATARAEAATARRVAEAAQVYFREFDHLINEDYPERRALRTALDSFARLA